MNDEQKGTVRVQVTSVDGNLTHPFQRKASIGAVREYSYEKLVQDKTAVPLSATSIELDGNAISDSESVGTLALGREGHGKDVDLSLALTWVSQGG
jgi:hypothetical protein